MKKVIKNLEKNLKDLREVIQLREDKVDSMCEKWQESEKCEEWEDKTLDIDCLADELECVIFSLNELR